MPKRKNRGGSVECFETKKEIDAINIQNNGDYLSLNTETFNCLICMDIRPINNIFQPYKFTNNPTITTTTCSHPFCIVCISKHIDAKVQENITSIKCPDVDCKTEIEFDCCINIIPKLVLDRWEESLSKSMILSSTSLYCPFKDCSEALLEAEEGSCGVEKSTKVKAECPHCQRKFCTKCIVAWHDGIDCEAFENLEDSEKANEDVLLRNLAKEKRWVRCPSCKFYVERIGGCSELICRCGHNFCYECGLSVYEDGKKMEECRCHIDIGEFE